MGNNILKKIEDIYKEVTPYERRGLDTSSLKIFIKNFKQFIKLNEDFRTSEELTFEDKLAIIKEFLEDKKAFPTINDVIDFANNRLNLEFRSQKESREITISRIVSRIVSKPELKDTLKDAVISIRNEISHNFISTSSNTRVKKDVINAEIFQKWAEIIKNI